MGYDNSTNSNAIGNGGAGNPGVWDIISGASHDLGGKTVAALMSLDTAGGTFTAMEEETGIGHAGKKGVSTAVAAKYLTYTYPQNVIFEGRYTKLTPAGSCLFKVWFLK